MLALSSSCAWFSAIWCHPSFSRIFPSTILLIYVCSWNLTPQLSTDLKMIALSKVWKRKKSKHKYRWVTFYNQKKTSSKEGRILGKNKDRSSLSWWTHLGLHQSLRPPATEAMSFPRKDEGAGAAFRGFRESSELLTSRKFVIKVSGVKVSKFQKQIFLLPYPPKNEQLFFWFLP